MRTVLLALVLVGGNAVLAQSSQSSPPARPGPALAQAAERQVGVTLLYDPAYVRLAYPGGDLPLERGVCADVVVRAFRAIGVDLQVALHEDMARDFDAYPRRGGRRGVCGRERAEWGEAVGWVEHFDPDLAAGLSWADAFMRSPEALALFLEACGQAVLERAGEILAERVRHSV